MNGDCVIPCTSLAVCGFMILLNLFGIICVKLRISFFSDQ